MNTPSILVVDDDPNNFEVIEAFLDSQNYLLHYVSSGEEISNTLNIYQPDLILLDVMMPGIDGVEVCKLIKADPMWRSIPIIMVTALNSKSELGNCIAAGADDFISKPVNAIELRARIRSMLRIKKQYDDVQDLLKQRQDMVNMVVHDLRNPLSSILIGLELLNISDYSPEKRTAKVSQIYAAAQSLQTLIDDLLKIALFESGKIVLNRQSIDLCKLLKDCVEGFEPIAALRKQSIVLNLPKDRPQEVALDAAMMRRTFDNILSNASKFSPKNSLIAVDFDCLEEKARVRIIDSGPGVPDELRHKIFEKYEIGNLVANIPQIGLGLAFCKMVVESHGGYIGVENNQPKGSVFEIIFDLPTLNPIDE